MTSTESMELQGHIPVASISDIGTQVPGFGAIFGRQLKDWGFMAVEVPGIAQVTNDLLTAFADACRSQTPSLAAFQHTKIPQLRAGGNHGFFPLHAEIPRLAGGVPDPKEHVHVSGAMLTNTPEGSRAMLDAFADLHRYAAEVFGVAFGLVTLFADVVRHLLPPGTPSLGLSREASILRVIHYLQTDDREVLAHEHSGIQMLGIQLPPSDGGLQYVLNDGTWVEPRLAGTDVVLCNIGRMLSAASNGQFRPSTHRVWRPASASPTGYERLSSVLFAYPDYDAAQWSVTKNGVVFESATWGDFIRNRFVGLSSSAQ